ncbi:MAG TPA: trypsin-like peptidase domain-containing protein, partial [Alphaproteobacteria bacterium]|nr:trypsin-like peptidase domain-containing protein [Alphaproteobacteria bacterium]
MLATLWPVGAYAAPADTVPRSKTEVRHSFAPLVKKTGPAVVNIYAKRVVRQRFVSPFFNDPFFGQFFGTPGFGGQVRERVESSLGSGVIVDAKGLIATNTHVIQGAVEIRVVTADGREFDAEKVLMDDRTDLAILKINPAGEALPYLDLADSDTLEVGDLVLAIGNPFGIGQTVTGGIVSGLARTGVGPTDYRFFIQTDAAINPGNSGGALVDVDGKLIGINTMIFSRDGGSLGIGFAIPANMVATVIQASRSGGGRIVRPWTGVNAQPVTPELLESLGLNRARGALITRVHPQSPAA